MSLLRPGAENAGRAGVEFEEINLTREQDRIGEIVSLTGGRKVPVIVEDNHVDVGFQGGG